MKQLYQFMRNNNYYFVAIFASILLTELMYYYYPVFNSDGVLYLAHAKFFLDHGLRHSLLHTNFKMPLYSVMIAIVSHFLHLSLLKTAYVINTVFDVLTACLFLLLVKQLGGARRIVWLALVVFLIYTPFNHYRMQIIRGHGYWFFYLLSIYYLLRLSDNYSFLSAMGWFVSAIMATAFRIEGGVFLIFAPMVIFTFQRARFLLRFRAFLYCIFPFVVALLGFVFFAALHPVFLKHMSQIARLLEAFSNGAVILITSLQQMALHIRSSVLFHLVSPDDIKAFLISGLLGVYFYNMITLISVGYLICFVFSFVPSSKINREKYFILVWFLILNCILTAAFMIQWQGFISLRYLFPLALTALCLVPFGLNNLYEMWRAKKSVWISIGFYLVCLSMVVLFFGSLLHFGPSKRYIAEAAKFIRQKTSKTARIYTNHAVLGAMVNRVVGGVNPQASDHFTLKNASKSPWRGYNTAVFVLTKDDQAELRTINAKIGIKPMQIFYGNHRRDAAYIYQLSK